MRQLRRRFAFWYTNLFVPLACRPLNPIVLRVLESRFHRLLPLYVGALRFEGRRSGRRYRVPFMVRRLDERTFECTTNRRRMWWHNLRGGVPASFLHEGRWLEATAQAVEDASEIELALRRRGRVHAWLFDVPVKESVVVRITLR